jgi:hypothetical protein
VNDSTVGVPSHRRDRRAALRTAAEAHSREGDRPRGRDNPARLGEGQDANGVALELYRARRGRARTHRLRILEEPLPRHAGRGAGGRRASSSPTRTVATQGHDADRPRARRRPRAPPSPLLRRSVICARDREDGDPRRLSDRAHHPCAGALKRVREPDHRSGSGTYRGSIVAESRRSWRSTTDRTALSAFVNRRGTPEHLSQVLLSEALSPAQLEQQQE